MGLLRKQDVPATSVLQFLVEPRFERGGVQWYWSVCHDDVLVADGVASTRDGARSTAEKTADAYVGWIRADHQPDAWTRPVDDIPI